MYDFQDKESKEQAYIEYTRELYVTRATDDEAWPFVRTAARGVAHAMMRAAVSAGITGEQLEQLRRTANVYAPFSSGYADEYL